MDFLQFGERTAKKTAFEHALHLSHSRIQPQNLFYTKDTKELTYRLKVDPALYVHKDPSISLGTYMSLMDSLTTLALVGSSSSTASGLRPGVSVQLQAELTASSSESLPTHVDITSKVTKVGRSLAFLRADVRNVDTGKMLCFGSHVKYLPSGSMWMDMGLSRWGWPWVRSFVLKTRPEPVDSGGDNLRQVILPHLQHTATGRATFNVKTAHTNAFGGLYVSQNVEQAINFSSHTHTQDVGQGGCQAILMELVGETLAKEELKTPHVVLEAMQVMYLSVGKKQVEIVAETISTDSTSVFMRVLILSGAKDGRLVSEGTLRWKSSPQSK